MIGCPMRSEAVRAASPVACGRARICYLCGTDLPKVARRWCSAACSDRYWQNHGWGVARDHALSRATIGHGHHGSLVLCDDCGQPCYDKPGSWMTAERIAEWPFSGSTAEVNHVEPRVGRGYGEGCHNHQTNLAVLCHACHVEETHRQRRERPVLDALAAGAISVDEAADLIDFMDRKRRGLVPGVMGRTPGFRRADEMTLGLVG